MKNIKIITILLLAFTLIFNVSIFAENSIDSKTSVKEHNDEGINMIPITIVDNTNMTKEQKIDKLVTMGIKREDAIILPDGLINELLKDDGIVVKYNIKASAIESYGKNKKLKEYKENILSVMPQTDIYIYNFVVTINEKPGYDNFKFVTYANWKINPVWRLTDCIATAWSDEFTLYSDTCTYTARDVGGYYSSWTCPRNNVVPEAGVAHNIDIRDNYDEHSINQVVKVYKNASTGTANIVTEYAHEEIGLSAISVGISATGGVPTIGFGCNVGSLLEEAIPGYSSFNY